MRSRRSARRRIGGGRAGLVGALAATGLVTAVATAVTASLVGGTSTGRLPIEAAAKVDPAATVTEPAHPEDRRESAARPVLRVTERMAPTAPSPPGSASTPMTVTGHSGGGSMPSTITTPAPVAPGDPDARFVTRPPGAVLASGAECAARIRPTPENVPENRSRNQTRGGPVSGTYLSVTTSIAANDYEARIDGDFVGSTDEIIQWAACKWGFDEDILRAQVYAESTWYAGKLGDCGEATVAETGGCASVGLIQVRSAERGATHHPGVYPQAWQSSALNLDYGLAVQRLCFEGLESWLGQTGDYRAGDQWNCLGRWFSGSWADAGSADYQATVRDILARRPWETRVGCRDWQTNNHCGG